MAGRAARHEGPHRRRGTWGEASAPRGRHAQRRRVLPPAQAAAGLRLRRALPGPDRAGRPARARPGAAAHRVLRHLEPRPHRQGRVDGGVRGRPAEALGLPPLPRSRAWSVRTISHPWRRCCAGGSRACSRSGPRLRPRGGGSRTRRRSSWSTAAAASSASRRRCSASSASGSRTSASRSASRRCTSPIDPDPLLIPRGSEALFVLQHLRDEAHRFAITFHRQKRERRALRSPLDEVAGRRAGPQEGAAEAVRVARSTATRRRRARSPRRRASAPSSRPRSTPGCTMPTPAFAHSCASRASSPTAG